MLSKQQEADVLPEKDLRQTYQALIGRAGTAKSAMLPGGAIVIGDTTYEAVSESGALDAGDRVLVVRIRNNRQVVRKAEDHSGSTTDDSDQNPLSQPIESFGIDPLDDPLS